MSVEIVRAAPQTARMAGAPRTLNMFTRLSPRALGILGAGLGSGLAAADEFGDGDGLGKDTAQASARFLGDLATSGGLALLGTAILPGVGTVALPALGALLGVQDRVGKGAAGIGGGIYDALFNRPEQVLERKLALARKMREFDQETADMNSERMKQMMMLQTGLQGQLNTQADANALLQAASQARY